GSGAGSFVADEFFNGGSASSHTTTIDTSGVTNPAPQGVYQTERWGVFTYLIPGLTAGGSYQVRLHFAELAFSSPGARVFNVAINGSTVLSNFDIVATAGAKDKAIAEAFNATADVNGQITIAYQTGTANFPKSSGIEIIPLGSIPPDFSVSATPSTQSVAPGGSTTYTVTVGSLGGFSGTVGLGVSGLPTGATAGFNPNTISGSGSSLLTVNTTSSTPGGTYTLTISGTSGSTTHTASVSLAVTVPGATQINSGGGTVGSWLADTDFSGGGSSANTNKIDTSGGTNPAPMAVYQSERWGVFTYAVPNLTAGESYQVRLHFAEIAFGSAGARVFNVAINGSTVLSNFDIFATAGGANKALVEQFTSTADATGKITISYIQGSADLPKSSGIEIVPASPPPALLQVSSGGGAVSPWVPDQDFSGGSTSTVTATINTSGVTNPAPAAVYQNERWGVFTYTIPSLVAGHVYTVRLHFAEIAFTSAGARLFSVAINGSTALSNFDIFATAGGANKALVEQFTSTADATGK